MGGGEFNITVIIINKENIDLKVTDDMTIDKIMEMIAERINVLAKDITLTFKGNILENALTVESCSIGPDDNLFASIKPPQSKIVKQPNEALTVVFAFSTQKKKCDVKPSDKLEQLLEHASKLFSLNSKLEYNILYKGVRIAANDSIASLNIKEDDELFIYIKSGGGFL